MRNEYETWLLELGGRVTTFMVYENANEVVVIPSGLWYR